MEYKKITKQRTIKNLFCHSGNVVYASETYFPPFPTRSFVSSMTVIAYVIRIKIFVQTTAEVEGIETTVGGGFKGEGWSERNGNRLLKHRRRFAVVAATAATAVILVSISIVIRRVPHSRYTGTTCGGCE